ncbi:MAG: hypothetical protein ACRD21_28325, partial [Vicinamibacteria bacterium]
MIPSEWVDSLGPHSTPEDVAPLLDHRDTDEAHLLRLLRKRELPSAVIAAIARHERWNGRHLLRAAIVLHAKSPRTLSLRLLSLLLWRDQLRVATDIRLPVPLRTAAESRLRERLKELELGERISLARSAPKGLLSLLVFDESPRVIEALLHNPRLLEADVLSLLRRSETAKDVLRAVAGSERWTNRPSIRIGVIQHPNTPVHTALSLLSRLGAAEIRKLIREKPLPPVVKLGAERILSGEKTPGKG